jgi:CheY-like chemotaxis protein
MSLQTILVADEDQDTRIILRSLLERQGFAVVEARSADEAMRAAQRPLALVILNHPLSVTEDLSLARWLRGNQATRDVPIINLTSRSVPLLIEEAARQGVNVTVSKPLDVHMILNLVQQFTTPTIAV